MADASYSQGNYHAQGGLQFVVVNGGSIKLESGAKILPNSGTQAANFAAFASSANMSAAQITKLNAIRTALINIGALATS
jgi:hypothetical protein